ncbi:Pkinase domain-containing protein/LRR_1 domain-containing protein/LRRNT_2 domain-containing protein/LRR_8 domain-containing protein, partial [Cephalotus follicularis]
NYTDHSALIGFQSAIDFDPTNTLVGNWSEASNFCNWVGVSCDQQHQRVTALNLSYMGLQGIISHVGNLSFLVTLDLRNNSFHGSLPHEISQLSRLRTLVLQFNQLEGNIPLSLHHCQSLVLLSLEGNQFSGGIPKELGMLPSLRELNLRNNNLMGAIPLSLGNISTLQVLGLRETGVTGLFPSSLYNLTSLISIDIRRNSISGILPTNLCSHWPNIQTLYLAFNLFGAQLPSTIYQCRELVLLSLGYNELDGTIPREIGSLKKLELLDLGGNNLVGAIPPTISNMSRLQTLSMEDNYIKGGIPYGIRLLSNLSLLNFEMNNLTGEVPPEIFNMSSLRVISLMQNTLSGNLPPDNGIWLPNLEELYFAGNKLDGHIPSYFSNFSKLVHLDLASNLLTGPIPSSLGNLKHLQYLALHMNKLTAELGNPELGFLTSLSNCRSLETLVLHSNPLNGIMPESIENFSSSLQIFYAPDSQIKGPIPKAIGSWKKLTYLQLSSNNLSGNIPSTVGGLERLQRLYLDSNMIEGFIPEELCNLSQLAELTLSDNKLSGSIPSCIGNLSLLQKLSLSSNRFTFSVPLNFWELENLLLLDLSSNSLSGYLPPNLRKSKVMESINLSWNQIVGSIPSILGNFESLSSLNLSRNSFQGSIPESFGSLRALDIIDLSYNNLSGNIPKSLETLPHLKYLNLSFNKLKGEIPDGGPFANFTAASFLENTELCGKSTFGVPACRFPSTRGSGVKKILLKFILPSIASFLVLVSLIYVLRHYQQSKVQLPSFVDNTLPTVDRKTISYQELRHATNDFCESNLLGKGSFGSVYKGVLSDGVIVAVKVLNLQLEGAFKSFDAECKVLRTMRHRNLVKVISSCSNTELRALVLQYMSNGDLQNWLHSHKYCLDILQRVNIMIDVASAVEYLHHGLAEPVVHCDLKPSNILLNDDMVGHVSDFGIAKILAKNKDATQTETLGSIGYIAPEFGSEGKVSTSGDVYSYGIMLLEMITGKKPTDEMFAGELSLRQWVCASFPKKLMEVVDGGLLSKDGRNMIATQSALLSLVELGLECSKELPEERIDISDMVIKLKEIKPVFFREKTKVLNIYAGP